MSKHSIRAGRWSRSSAFARARVAFSPASRTVLKRRTWLVRALSRAIFTRSNAAPLFGVRTSTREPRRSESHVSTGASASSGTSSGRWTSLGRNVVAS